jgi:hypothetical protein
MSTASVTGLDGLLANLSGLQRGVSEAAKAGAAKDADRVLQIALELVPRDTGHLASTGYSRDGEVGFTADYALLVEEDTSAQHPNGQAKFLRTALDRVAGEVTQGGGETGKAIQAAIEKAGRP